MKLKELNKILEDAEKKGFGELEVLFYSNRLGHIKSDINKVVLPTVSTVQTVEIIGDY